MSRILPSVGHVLHYGFSYTPTTLQTVRQLQISLAAQGARQAAFGNRMTDSRLPTPAPAPRKGLFASIFGSVAANFLIHGQRDNWKSLETLVVYNASQFPAARSHEGIIFVMAGKRWQRDSRRWNHRFRRFLSQIAWKRAACVVTTETHWLRMFGMQARAGEFRYRRVRPGVWHIPPFVDSRIFHPGCAADRFSSLNPVLYWGDLSRGSGFHLFADAFAEFAAARPEANLLAIGARPRRSDLARAMRMFSRPGLAGRAFYLGEPPEAALPEILASARMAVFPLLEDQDAKTLALHSMASGAATLSTSRGGLEDFPTIKIEPTPEGLTQAMDRAWEQSDEIGARQSEQTHAQFSLESWERAWMKVFREARARMLGMSEYF